MCALLAASPIACIAAKKISVADLEIRLPQVCAHSTDENCASQIADMELTERLSSAKLAELYATLPGEKSRQSLLALADESAILEPPAASIPATPAPNIADQRHIMELVVAYVSKTIPNLPNFFATRQVTHFEDQPQMQAEFNIVPFKPLHSTSQTQATILYRNGIEVVDNGKEVKTASETKATGLISWGTFGPVLGIVLVDAANSSLSWSHWEDGNRGQLAVFQYAVPQSKSHYKVDYCCVAELRSAIADAIPFRQSVGYHGEIAVDPATGVIERLTVLADLKPTDPISLAEIAVEYGPVEIGGKQYTCPLHSIAISKAQLTRYDPVSRRPLALAYTPIQTRLNDYQYGDFHVFRADARIVVDEAKASPPKDSPPVEHADSDQQVASAGNSGSKSSNSPAGTGSATEENATPPPTSAVAAADSSRIETKPAPMGPSSTATTAKSEPEFTLEGEARVPVATQSANTDTGNLTLHTESRLVDVSVVVTDRKGKPVLNLKPGDFVVEDDGVPQIIKFFAEPTAVAPVTSAATPDATPDSTERDTEPVFSNKATASKKISARQNSVILLIDSSNLAFGDLSYARQQMQSFLKSVDSSIPVGLYILGSEGYRILIEPTLDHTIVSDKLAHWMPTAHDLAQAQQEEALNRQQIDEVHKVSDLSRVNGNTNFADPNGGTDALDPQLRDFGRNPGRDALAFLLPVADHLSSLPGHKSLVWVASDNVLVDWAGRSADLGNSNASLSAATLRAQEALNDAHVSIYPLDASQLEAGGVDASMRHRNVQLNQAAQDVVGLASLATGGSPSGAASTDSMPSYSTGRNMQPGRATAQMQHDIHAIAPLYQEMAKATGGRSLRRAGDIAGELHGIAADGDATYELSFSPKEGADDKYHRIDVKVNTHERVKLRFRTDYFYAKQPITLHDRFQKAIWQAADMKEIGLTANAAQTADGEGLKLRVDVSDLGLTEQNGRWVGKIELFLIKRENASGRARISGRTIGLSLLPATYQNALKDGLPLNTAIPAKLNSGDLRILLLDQSSQRIGTLTIPASQLADARADTQHAKR
ncbi:MAG: VWA domain-containing protein [Acidobacteriota bacterium]|nr:VWA domain-containing protein [Acidobacteriota bacterium]